MKNTQNALCCHVPSHSISEVSMQEAHSGNLFVLTNSKCLFKWLIYRKHKNVNFCIWSHADSFGFYCQRFWDFGRWDSLLSPQHNWEEWRFIHGAQRIKKMKLKNPTVPLWQYNVPFQKQCPQKNPQTSLWILIYTLFLTFTAIKTDINKDNGAILATNPQWKLVNELKLMQYLSGRWNNSRTYKKSRAPNKSWHLQSCKSLQRAVSGVSQTLGCVDKWIFMTVGTITISISFHQDSGLNYSTHEAPQCLWT